MSLKRSQGSTPGLGSKVIGQTGSVSCARASLTADWTITTTATWTPIEWDQEDFDTDNYWEGVTNPSRFTAPVDGYYRVTASIALQSDQDGGAAIAGYWVNGADADTQQAFGRHEFDTTFVMGFNGSDIVYLSATHYIEFIAYVQGSTTKDVKTDDSFGLIEYLGT